MTESTILQLATLAASSYLAYVQLKMHATQKDMQKVTSSTNRYLNGDRSATLATTARVTRRLADLENTPENVEAAIVAARALIDHEAQSIHTAAVQTVADIAAAAAAAAAAKAPR